MFMNITASGFTSQAFQTKQLKWKYHSTYTYTPKCAICKAGSHDSHTVFNFTVFYQNWRLGKRSYFYNFPKNGVLTVISNTDVIEIPESEVSYVGFTANRSFAKTSKRLTFYLTKLESFDLPRMENYCFLKDHSPLLSIIEIFLCCLPFQDHVLAWRFSVQFVLSVKEKWCILVANAVTCFAFT